MSKKPNPGPSAWRPNAGSRPSTSTLRERLAGFGDLNLSDLYLLPATPPSSNPGDQGNARDGSTLVLAF